MVTCAVLSVCVGGAECTVILPANTQQLRLKGEADSLLQTMNQASMVILLTFM